MSSQGSSQGRRSPAAVAPPVLGVDGWRGGWVGALVVGGRVEWRLFDDAAEVLDGPYAGVGIDIPIGLPEVGPRRCDLAVRAALGRARSSLFLVPPRAAILAADYRTATEVAATRTGSKFSIQTWGLAGKIRTSRARIIGRVARRVIAYRLLKPLRTFSRSFLV